MELSFDTKDLRALCENELLALERLGSASADALKNRLADIRAADTIHDVLAGKPQSIKYNQQDAYRFELFDGNALVMIPAHKKPKLDEQRRVKWKTVRRVRVVLLGKEQE